MRHLGTQPLETERLILRRLVPEDAADMYRNWAADSEVTRYLTWDPHKNDAETRELLTVWADLYANADYYQWAIAEKGSGEAIGSFSISNSLLGRHAAPSSWHTLGLDCTQGVWELGYCIGRPWWGRGYMTEALRAAAAFWFDQVGGEWLVAAHAAENPASGAVMRKAGFVFHHESVYHRLSGEPVPALVYLLRREDFIRA